MLAFTYQRINGKINLIKISQGSDYEKINSNDDLWISRGD